MQILAEATKWKGAAKDFIRIPSELRAWLGRSETAVVNPICVFTPPKSEFLAFSRRSSMVFLRKRCTPFRSSTFKRISRFKSHNLGRFVFSWNAAFTRIRSGLKCNTVEELLWDMSLAQCSLSGCQGAELNAGLPAGCKQFHHQTKTVNSGSKLASNSGLT